MTVIGLLLAAGRGRRMGGNKQFHVVPTSDGDKSLVCAAFDTIAPECEQIFVVLGHRDEEVAEILAPRTFEIVAADPDAPMIDSIKAGLRAILSRRATLSEPLVILLQLGDHPALERTTLIQLLDIAAEHSDKAVMPTFEGTGGHPVAIPVKVARQIVASPCQDGLRQFWLEHSELCFRVPVGDHRVLVDIDTNSPDNLAMH